MRKYVTTILLFSSLLLSELHTFWENASANIQNWILYRSVPMSLQWNIKMVTDQAWYVLIFIAMLFYKPNRINKTTVIVFIANAISDTIMYFINYKTYHYVYVYVALFILWPIVYRTQYKRRSIKQDYLYHELNW